MRGEVFELIIHQRLREAHSFKQGCFIPAQQVKLQVSLIRVERVGTVKKYPYAFVTKK